ncbi:MAG: hypothetical protein JW803_01885 [Endomicrobiales bacterium]|nr:hypothetical protein [Endomicrobiales bacterium]
MKLKLPIITLILMWGLALGEAKASFQPGVFSIDGCPPTMMADFSDLDARDASNNPVATAEAKEDLKEIFQSGLFNLLVNSELYSVAQTLSALAKQINACAHTISRNLPIAVKTLIAVIFTTIKGISKAQPHGSGLFVLTLLFVSLLVSQLRFMSVNIRTFSPAIRC